MANIAVIDIGTNAIRGVVYDKLNIGAVEINNKQFSYTFHPIQYNKNKLLNIMSFFRDLHDKLQIKKTILVGTASMRNFDSKPIIADIKKKYNFDIKVLSGEKEAEYVGKAVDISIQDANGVIADLGGGSLELSCIKNHKVFDITSINLHSKNIINLITENFLECIKDEGLKNLYIVGGSFRAISKSYAKSINHFLDPISHYFSIKSEKMIEFISSHPKKDHTAYNILLHLLKNLTLQNVILSNYGVKEGVFFSHFNNYTYTDLILSKALNITKKNISSQKINQYLRIIKKIIPTYDNKYNKILHIALMFITSNLCINYSNKSKMLQQWIMNVNIPFSTEHRIMLYVVMHYTFTSNCENIINSQIAQLISNKEFHIAKIFGTIISITHHIHGYLPNDINFNIFMLNNKAFIKCNSLLHQDIFRQVRYLTYKINESINKINKNTN